MSEQAAFARVVAALYDAMLDETHWPATSALLDEACGVAGNALLVGEGPPDDTRVTFAGLYYRGQRRLDLEREYLEVYHPINEAIPRQLQLPAGQLVPLKDLYTAEELKTSRTYNEALRRGQYQQGVNVLLAGPGGSGMTWSLADPVAAEGCGSSPIAMVRRLMPVRLEFPILSLHPGLRQRCVVPDTRPWSRPTSWERLSAGLAALAGQDAGDVVP